MMAHAKPGPDLFLAAAALLGIEPRHAFVVGDSVWDLLAARRAGAIGVGVLSGGYGREELERAGAHRVYADPADLLARADEVGIRLSQLTPRSGVTPAAARLDAHRASAVVDEHSARPGTLQPKRLVISCAICSGASSWM
jgi:ribonucleotide monophosphatase NagD (HAD superfamily)